MTLRLIIINVITLFICLYMDFPVIYCISPLVGLVLSVLLYMYGEEDEDDIL